MGLVWFVTGVAVLPLLHQWQHAQTPHHSSWEDQRIAASLEAVAQDAWDALALSEEPSSTKQASVQPASLSSVRPPAVAVVPVPSWERLTPHEQAHHHGTPHSHDSSQTLRGEEHSHGEPLQGSHSHGEGTLWHFGLSLCPSLSFAAVLVVYPPTRYRNLFSFSHLENKHDRYPSQPRAPPVGLPDFSV
ncbi:MAG: hypothetical protein EP343_18390 [Deltaproteobacteria bacterium]|nr:MAG: hypothetical protein EP343_18390 [Deltaproteobacteria bacterium]